MKVIRPPMTNFKPGDYPIGKQFDVCELKFDGIWGSILIENGIYQIWSRSGQLKKEGKVSDGIRKTLFQSEYLFASEWAKDRPELYGKLAVFDAQLINGKNVSMLPNREVRKEIAKFLRTYRADPMIQRCFLIDQWPIKQARDIWEDEVGPTGFEGLIFKNSSRCWGQPCGRMKRMQTIDYVCLGFEESDSITYAGIGVRSIIGGLYTNGSLVEICRVGGLTDIQRREYYENSEKFIGKVFEASGYRVSKRGALRHPNFLHFRDDKDPKECRWP